MPGLYRGEVPALTTGATFSDASYSYTQGPVIRFGSRHRPNHKWWEETRVPTIWATPKPCLFINKRVYKQPGL